MMPLVSGLLLVLAKMVLAIDAKQLMEVLAAMMVTLPGGVICGWIEGLRFQW